jgi:predicted DCC family thiol-disulfide oxidoreductase YuxK
MAQPVVLFDGICNLCNWSVQFIIKHDPQGRFRFASLQSTSGQQLLALHGIHTQAIDSLVLIVGSHWYARSIAALEIARRLAWPWPLVYALVIVPRPLRDWAYDLIARNRYRWFGRKETCIVPTPALRDRFLS